MHRLLVLFIYIFACAQALHSQQSRFDQWDKNKDGKLIREELPSNLQKNFKRVDKNGDGFISREEDALVGQKQGERSRLPKGVKLLKDLDYADNDNPRQKLDLYLPGNPVVDEALPVIAFIHGGGWQNGDKSTGEKRVGAFVATGKYAAVSIGYRLTDEAQWPSQIHDCKAAIRWIRANAGKYNLDANKIAVWGTSAGGHLVAMLGVSHGVEGLEGNIGPNTKHSSEVACVVDFFGPSELLTMDDHPGKMNHSAPDSPESKLVGGPIQENKKKAQEASPITHVSSDDGPFLIVHGDKDPLVPFPQSADFEKKLEAAGVSVIFLKVEDGGHGKGFGPTVNKTVENYLANKLLGAEKNLSDKTVKAGE